MMNKVTFSWCKEHITGYVYVISFGEESPVKIGYTQNVDHRLGELQVGNPYRLRIEVALPGNEKCERVLHEQFGNVWIRGEWFWPASYIRRVIRKMVLLERQLPEYRHLMRRVVEEQSGERLVDIVPEIKRFDIEVKSKPKDKYNA